MLRAAQSRPPRADAAALFQRGNVLHDEGRLDEAIEAYQASVRLQPDLAQAHNNLGVALRARGHLDEAIAACREAVRLQPTYASAWSNLGSVLQRRGRFEEAVPAYLESLRWNPKHATAHYNLGCALRLLGRADEAAAAFRAALRLKPDLADAHSNLGAVLREQGDLDAAREAYQNALRLKPQWGGPAAQIAHLCREMAEWNELEQRTAVLRQAIATDAPLSRGIPPFSVLTAGTTRAEQLRSARQWAAHAQLALAERSLYREPRSKGSPRPLRIGYLSADFHDHATGYLIAGLLESHDPHAVHVTAYSYGRPSTGSLRDRLRAACAQFVDVSGLSDEEAALRIAADAIDILVDLKGYTQHARTGILTFRAAPIQVQFLGYPGTMGTPLVDYLIADPFVVPEAHSADYDEQIVRLPDCYQPNDPGRIVGPTPTRLEAGLPETGLVLCSFNENYKITPALFDVWMRLLQSAGDSVLWLLESNRWAADNLRREARARSVDPDRLVFARRVPNPTHLARLALADLMLDTYPVNGHTTASDALWMGLPVLTCSGDTFVSRVAGSLLQTMGLVELVTASLDEYERKARELSMQREALAQLKATVRERRHASALFDAVRFARHLERAYQVMWDRHVRGEAPAAIAVEQIGI
jgi:protein O-GlcNAc transferase